MSPQPRRPRRYTETTDYLTMVRRLIRRAGERVAVADMPELEHLLALREALDDAIAVAIPGVKDNGGYSWTAIGEAAGTTRQAAQQRYGPRALARRLRTRGHALAA